MGYRSTKGDKIMWESEPIFWDYITHDEHGRVNGVRDDAPEEMKKAYEEWAKVEEEARKLGMMI